MSEEFSDDFVIEEEEASNRPFLIIAGSLIGIFIIIAACVLGYVLLQRNQQSQTSDEIAQIESANATTQAQNALVTQTIQALETEAARPTDTPMPTATQVPPTETPRPPTETPVVQPEAAASATATPEATSTEEAIGVVPTATIVAGGNNGDQTLPQTGFGTIGLAASALGLVALLVLARRLRTG